MSFLKKLFGGGEASSDEPKGDAVLGKEDYKDFTIKAIEMRAGSEYQLAGTIEKEVDGEIKSYRFVRADRMGSKDDLIALAINKGRQIIDEQGTGIFN
ncbi:HlyU family transcriptional regulator [Devosia rhodophyticola]|uniref:HlyU family transcriptional regulator n=1 Tax=Devosia rhodophyticola TaxID=3026423 RepID=A0ABY7YUY0_9HYPH|nr:HlyU family transcriptional regulator [Devosia rhodophyticola]WDR05168.1 HlyU family transcriptional regulator [Devosia rhodophyticola]